MGLTGSGISGDVSADDGGLLKNKVARRGATGDPEKNPETK